uniref:PH domain-containing protein n=1 Tax=Ditylenchus dipsaci TaxID=166011 RepID=A0A915CNS6_9BILA
MSPHFSSIMKTSSEVTEKSGTLLRKKKYVYEQWVAFCIHDDKVPLLEWYYSESSVAEHEPLKVQDLFGCLFVNVAICDDRCFVIGFTDDDRPAIELSAATARECNEWVHDISSSLKRLNYLDESENIYSELPLRQPDKLAEELPSLRFTATSAHPTFTTAKLPVASPSPSMKNRVLCLSDRIPMQPTSFSGDLEMDEKSAKKSVSTPNVSTSSSLKMPLKLQHQISVKETQDPEHSEPVDEEYPPPLPPRKLNSSSSHSSVSIGSPGKKRSQYDFTTNFPPPPLPNYDDLLSARNELLEPVYNLLAFSNNQKSSFDTQELHEEMEKDEFRPHSSCKIRAPTSTGISSLRQQLYGHGLAFSSTAEKTAIRPASSPPPTLKDPFDTFKNPEQAQNNISSADHLFWIAGWNPEKDNYLRNIIHFGDEVVQIGNVPVRSLQQISHLFFTQSLPGTPIALTVRSIPYGSVYSITKPLNPKKSLGIVLHKKKNMIASIEDKSVAMLAKVPSKVPPYVYGSAEVSAVITEIDGIPLNPYAKNEQFFQRLERLSQGTVFNVVVQPRDLVKLLKQKLKHSNNYKKLIHDL